MALIIIFFVGKILKIPLLSQLPFIPYFFCIYLFICIINVVDGIRLMNYIKENHFEKWEDLTSLPFMGSGNANGFKAIKFVFLSDNFQDEILLKLKNNHKKLIILAIVAFISIPISLLILVLLHINRIIIFKIF